MCVCSMFSISLFRQVHCTVLWSAEGAASELVTPTDPVINCKLDTAVVEWRSLKKRLHVMGNPDHPLHQIYLNSSHLALDSQIHRVLSDSVHNKEEDGFQ